MMKATIKLSQTMLDKSIIDANESVRKWAFFWHELDIDGLAAEEYDPSTGDLVKLRVVLRAVFSEDNSPSEIRLYRTKRGDRRVSVKGLSKRASGGDTIVFTCKNVGAFDGLDDGSSIINIIKGDK